ncbi:hypothetical protein CMK11_15035 [Candidatus Poribacteria bacterium]|nr:hypothetical protein [Candidatus Poribacteria bacterium]
MSINSTVGSQDIGRWIRPTGPDEPIVWGRSDGVGFGLPSDGGMPGPRGLIRIGIWNRAEERAELINFVAVEPVVEGDEPRGKRMGYSELEASQLDPGRHGKRLWTTGPAAGEIGTLPSGVETLTVPIDVETFTANGARVHLIAQMRSDRPTEVSFSVYHHDDSAPIAEHTLTATMGNYGRLRLLWLRDRVVDSRALYDTYDDIHFAHGDPYPLGDMIRLEDGSAFVMCSANEADPASVSVDHPWWGYDSVKLTQYWRVPPEHVQADLRVRVNGRRVYWAQELEIPGGVSFENFEVRQSYVPGQQSVFGLTQTEPTELAPTVARFAPDTE